MEIPEELQEKLLEIKKLPPEEQEEAAHKLLTPEEISILTQQGDTKACFFCQIAHGQVQARIVYEDDFVMAVLDKNPANPGHTLVMPKEHYPVLPQVPADRAVLLMNLIRTLSGAIFDATNAQGVTILQANGAAAGQTVPHVFFHIIPRFEGDKVKTDWKRMELSEKQLDEIQHRIVEKAKTIALEKPVYDISGKPIEETKTKLAKPSEKPKTQKEKLMKVKRRLP